MSKITIPKDEFGKVRLFALSMPDDAAEALKDNQTGQARALGVKTVNTGQIEVFPVDDLGAMGLGGYLRAGIDANQDEIATDAARLDATKGWVMLAHSEAFGDTETVLDPVSELSLIGTYTLVQSDHANIALESDAAAPYSGIPTATPPVPPKGRAGGSLFVAALAVLIILVLWWAFT